MYNKNITKGMRNPGKMFIKLTSDELMEFFSKGLPRMAKEKCQQAYTLTDFRRGILEANHLVQTDTTIHIVDLMMYALGQLEDDEQIIEDLRQIIADYESNKKETTETEDKKEETKSKK